MRNHKIAAAREEMRDAAAAAVMLGLPDNPSPEEASLHCVAIAAGEVDYATKRVHDLPAELAVPQPVSQCTSSGVPPTLGLWVTRSTIQMVTRATTFTRSFFPKVSTASW
jgi:hypothetical protein